MTQPTLPVGTPILRWSRGEQCWVTTCSCGPVSRLDDKQRAYNEAEAHARGHRNLTPEGWGRVHAIQPPVGRIH